ncbi:MAG: hypothetical protein JXA89_03845 [Anaerolineae bacterium]|nr:hypothetical protein [Anaerolineae bacterium]
MAKQAPLDNRRFTDQQRKQTMRRARIAILWGLPIVVVLILIGFSLTLFRGWTTYPGAGLPGLLSEMDVDPDGRLWVQTKRDAADPQEQAWVWEGQGWRPSTPEGLFPAGETVELTDPSGRIWVLEQGRLDVFDGTAWSHIGPGIHTTNPIAPQGTRVWGWVDG